MPSQDSSLGKSSVCLITGGASGIGLEAARGISDCHLRVVITDKDMSRVEQAVEELKKENPERQAPGDTCLSIPAAGSRPKRWVCPHDPRPTQERLRV